MTNDSPFALRVTTPTGSWIRRLPKGRTIVGRSERADVEIAEILAARSHCALDWDDRPGRHLLSVWGPNGVSVNGAIVQAGTEPRPLSAGDEIRVGDVSLRYEGITEACG